MPKQKSQYSTILSIKKCAAKIPTCTLLNRKNDAVTSSAIRPSDLLERCSPYEKKWIAPCGREHSRRVGGRIEEIGLQFDDWDNRGCVVEERGFCGLGEVPQQWGTHKRAVFRVIEGFSWRGLLWRGCML